MDTVTILRDLWRLRLYVIGALLLALLAGAAVKVESHRHEVGVATARILVDTPRSQIAAVAPNGADTLGVRANLLASLMIDGAVKSRIADRAGLQPSQLVGETDAASASSSVAGGASSGSGPSSVSAPTGARTYVLTTHVLTDSLGEQLPIIEVDAQAPDGAGAGKLAGAAAAGLQDYLGSTAALQRISDADRLQISSLGPPQVTTEARGPSTLIAIVVAVAVFVLGCALILAVLALVRGWRAAATRERLNEELLLVDIADERRNARVHAGRPSGVEAADQPSPRIRSFVRTARSLPDASHHHASGNGNEYGNGNTSLNERAQSERTERSPQDVA